MRARTRNALIARRLFGVPLPPEARAELGLSEAEEPRAPRVGSFDQGVRGLASAEPVSAGAAFNEWMRTAAREGGARPDSTGRIH
jgi:hypothetical protein